MSETISRAEAVSSLWKLKQAAAKKRCSDIPYIHFNLLLSDNEYRRQILAIILNSQHDDLKSIAAPLQKASLQGRLIQSPVQSNMPILAAEQMAPAETLGGSNKALANGKPFSTLVYAISLILVLGAGVIIFILNPTLSNLKSSQHIIDSAIAKNSRWSSGSTYILDGIVYVDNGATLSIEPGVTIKGRPGSALVVTRDSQLLAQGSKTNPIVFTSASENGNRQPGDWGGLVLLGNAPVNEADAKIEGIDAQDSRGGYGGEQPDSSCGILEYVRIEYAGFEVYANNELNGLTLGGCGNQTIIRNVQVHMAMDDGIELFGGTADLKNVIITGAGDDGLDWDKGWTGRGQFIIVQQYPDRGDNAIEGDNDKNNPTGLPMSQPTLYNITLIGGFSDTKSQRGMVLRRGTGGIFKNLIMLGFSTEGIDIRDASTANNIDNATLSFGSIIMFEIGQDGKTFFQSESNDNDDNSFDESAYFSSLATLQFDVDPGFGFSVRTQHRPTFSPQNKPAVEQLASTPPQAEFWNEGARYLGALPPRARQTWLDGWSDFSVDG